LALLCGIVASSGLLASLGVVLGEARGPLQRTGKLRQDPRGPLRALPSLSRQKFSCACLAVCRIRLDQLGPPTF
jgi:hypothetical protein